MARRSTSSIKTPTWLRHQQLLTTEAVLLVALGMELLQRWVTSHHQVPWWLKTIEVMAVNAGMLGGMLLVITTVTRGSLSGATRAMQSLSLPAPLLLVHVVALAGIFVLYARVWEFWPR
jgi:hypothetical protein